MMDNKSKTNYITILKNIKYLKESNKLINKKIRSNEDFKENKKNSIISLIIGGLGIAASAIMLPVMLPLSLPFLITGAIVGGISGIVGLTYSLFSLNCLGKMRQIKENTFNAEGLLKKQQKQQIKEYKKMLKQYKKKDIKNNFNKKELKELKNAVSDSEKVTLNLILEGDISSINAQLNIEKENEKENVDNVNNNLELNENQNNITLDNAENVNKEELEINRTRSYYGNINIDTNKEKKNNNVIYVKPIPVEENDQKPTLNIDNENLMGKNT